MVTQTLKTIKYCDYSEKVCVWKMETGGERAGELLSWINIEPSKWSLVCLHVYLSVSTRFVWLFCSLPVVFYIYISFRFVHLWTINVTRANNTETAFMDRLFGLRSPSGKVGATEQNTKIIFFLCVVSVWLVRVNSAKRSKNGGWNETTRETKTSQYVIEHWNWLIVS